MYLKVFGILVIEKVKLQSVLPLVGMLSLNYVIKFIFSCNQTQTINNIWLKRYAGREKITMMTESINHNCQIALDQLLKYSLNQLCYPRISVVTMETKHARYRVTMSDLTTCVRKATDRKVFCHFSH